MTPAEVLARHVVKISDYDGVEYCFDCGSDWPCDAVVMARQLQEAIERVTTLGDLLAEGAEYGEWTHAHCDEDSGGVHRFDREWWKIDARAALAEPKP